MFIAKVKYLFIVLFLGVLPIVYAGNLSIEEYSNQEIIKIKNADFDSVFADYILPKDYTELNIQSDKEAITLALKELVGNQIGLLKEYTKIDTIPEEVISLDLGTGSAENIGRLPSTDIVYEANFEKLEKVYLTIRILKEDEKLFIKNIGFGLPASNPFSVQIANNFGNFMNNIAQEQQKKDLTTPKEVIIDRH